MITPDTIQGLINCPALGHNTATFIDWYNANSDPEKLWQKIQTNWGDNMWEIASLNAEAIKNLFEQDFYTSGNNFGKSLRIILE